jgi:hypothetical protein
MLPSGIEPDGGVAFGAICGSVLNDPAPMFAAIQMLDGFSSSSRGRAPRT